MSPRQQKSHADAIRWFKDKKRDLHLEIRAFNDFVVARDAILRIQEGIYPELDPHLQLTSSLFSTAVTFYARQFKQANNQYNERQNYPVGSLRKHDDFDNELHAHIISLRDRLIAHNDSRELPPHINVLNFTFKQEGISATMPVGATLTSYSLGTAATSSFLKRLANHLSACVNVVEGKMKLGIHSYLDEATKYPDANEASVEGPSRRFESKTVTLQTNESFEHVDLDEIRMQLVTEPAGSLSKEEYKYRMVSYSVVKEKVPFVLNGTESTLHLGPNIRSVRDVKRLIPKPTTRFWKRWQLIVGWFKAPIFQLSEDHQDSD
jgi:hypothetical protein